jgi:hypothetical protein
MVRPFKVKRGGNRENPVDSSKGNTYDVASMITDIAAARTGLLDNNFHAAAMCFPPRAARKSGCNHQVNNMGSIIGTGAWSGHF